MNEAFASWLFAQTSAPVWVAIALVGVTCLIVLIVVSFKSLFGDE